MTIVPKKNRTTSFLFMVAAPCLLLLACGGGGGGSDTSHRPTLPPAIQGFTANPSALTPGQGSTLKWTVSDATQLSIAPSVGDVTGLSSKNISPAATTLYTLTAQNAAGQSATANVTVIVNLAPVIDTDKFGINRFYPTKINGHIWDSQTIFAKTFNTDWDDLHAYDPEVYLTGNGQYTCTGNGELKVGKNSDGGESPRFYIGDGSRTWDGNVEVTFYSKVGAIDKVYTDGDPAWIWGGLEAVVRTSHYPETDACNSRGYGGRMTLDGDCDFEKEQSHPAGANSRTTPFYPWGTHTDIPTNKWIGYKFIARDQGTASNVHLELWLDSASNGILANQYWVKIVDFVDADNKIWTTQALAWCCPTHTNKSYRGVNQTSSKFVYLRTDGANPQYYKWISVREINPE